MTKISRFLFLFALVLAPAFGQGTRKIGEVVVAGDNVVTVRLSASSPELQSLAHVAFNSHGRYKVVSGNANYDLKFSAVSATQVRIEVTRGSGATPVASEIATGTTARQALLRAADIAVQKTSGIAGLRGYFTARLAFVGQRGSGRGEIMTSDLFLDEAKQLTRDNALVLMPRWSPDGSRLIYTSYFRKGAPDIYVLDATTARRTEFASFKGTNTSARFSPNGQQVAMILTGDGSPEIWTSNAQGTPASFVRRTRSEVVKASPCWSPDGSQIVFSMDPGPQLYVMPAGGGAPRRLAVGYSYAAEPDWSRTNPNKIACTVRVDGRFQIAVYDLSTGKGQVVSKASFDGIEPSWLADGRHLVYTARDRTTNVLCILDTETGKSTPLPAKLAASQASVLPLP